jgi:hypothetical protein
MASGFVQRFKGKVNFAPSGLWIGGSPLFGAGSAQNLTLASATVSIGAITNYGLTTINATSAVAIARLARPAYPGQAKTLQLTAISSAVFITASTDGSVTLNGSSINTTFKSTVASVITLVATSSANWAIDGLFPGSTTLSSILTLSTST